MAIPENMMEEFFFLDKKHNPDGEGGQYVTWEDGAAFRATASVDTTLEAVVAGVAKGQVVYALWTPIKVSIAYGDVVKRKKDGQIFRITAAGPTPPKESTIDLRKNQAEAWELPT